MRPPPRHRRRIAALAVLLTLAGTAASRAADPDPPAPDLLAVAIGPFGLRDGRGAGALAIEYQSGRKILALHPVFGMLATTDGGLFAHAGAALPIALGAGLTLSPSLAVGIPARGNGLDLGASIAFRSQLALAQRLSDRSRLTLAIGHISNAGIARQNPGVDYVLLGIAVTLGGATR
jgi:lipid A 3-O-deacylase